MLVRELTGSKIKSEDCKLKKLLLAAAACCAMGAPSMFGSSFFEFCAPFPTAFPAGAGSATITCAAPNAPGTILSIEVWDESDYDFGSTSFNSVTVSFTPDATLDTWAPVTLNCVVSGAGSSTSNTCGSYSGNETSPGTTTQAATPNAVGLAALNSTGWTVAVSSVVTNGSVNQSTGGVIAEVDYTTGTPEPGSMMLLGGGLLAAGLIGRKKFIRK
jgi:PEP-CTERM motif